MRLQADDGKSGHLEMTSLYGCPDVVVFVVVSVRASNTDKALVFVGLFLTLLVLFVLVTMLYCIAK